MTPEMVYQRFRKKRITTVTRLEYDNIYTLKMEYDYQAWNRHHITFNFYNISCTGNKFRVLKFTLEI